MTTPAVAHTSLDEARRAAEAEGIFEPTAEEKALVSRHRALRARADKIKAEMKAIEDSLKSSMEDRDALKLAVDGKNVVQWKPTTRTVYDAEAHRAAHPDVVVLYEEVKERFDASATPFIRSERETKHSFQVTP